MFQNHAIAARHFIRGVSAKRIAGWRCLWLGSVAALLACTGCKPPDSKAAASPPAEVSYVLPVERNYREYEEFTGRLQAINAVDIKPEVTGILEEVLFTDGADVDPKQPLFRIDARPYKAEAARTASLIDQYKAQVARLEHQYDRAKKLLGSGAVSQEEFEVLQYQRDEAEASQHSAEAANRAAELNVERSEIHSKFAGRAGKHMVDAGNLVKANETTLVSIVSLDPIYAFFDVDERTVLKISRGDSPKSTKDRLLGLPVHFALADQQGGGFPIDGEVVIVDNQLDAGTGTLRLWAKIPNSKFMLRPGNFVRCQFPIGDEKPGLFVPETALGSDQGQPFIYVITDKDEVAYRRVDVGPLEGKMRAIQSSLKAGERVMVSGLQRVKAGAKVSAKPYVEDGAGKAKTGNSGERESDRKDQNRVPKTELKSDSKTDPSAEKASEPPVHVTNDGKPAQ